MKSEIDKDYLVLLCYKLNKIDLMEFYLLVVVYGYVYVVLDG